MENRAPECLSSGDEPNELPKPESCRMAGLECRGCVQHAAANLARICPSLTVESLRDSFFKIYPYQACLPMNRTFVRAYRAAENEAEEEEEEFGEFSLLAVATA